jgi:hypothetical protein
MLAAAIAVVACLSTGAPAAPVRYHFSGTTNIEHQTSPSSPWQLSSQEQLFEGAFAYDSSNVAAPISDFTVALAGQAIEFPSMLFSARDQTLVLGGAVDYLHLDVFPGAASAALTFYDDDSSVLSIGRLPAALQLGEFDRVEFSLNGGHSMCPVYPADFCIQSQEVALSHRGIVTGLSAAPEPATWLLSLVGAAGCALVSRARHLVPRRTASLGE